MIKRLSQKVARKNCREDGKTVSFDIQLSFSSRLPGYKMPFETASFLLNSDYTFRKIIRYQSPVDQLGYRLQVDSYTGITGVSEAG
jgi:hypothetical protein